MRERRRAADEHGNVRPSASDSLPLPASFRCSKRFRRTDAHRPRTREPFGGLREFRAKAARPQIQICDGDRQRRSAMLAALPRVTPASPSISASRWSHKRQRIARARRIGRNSGQCLDLVSNERCRRHRAPADRALDSNKGPRSRRAPARRGMAPEPAPWRPAEHVMGHKPSISPLAARRRGRACVCGRPPADRPQSSAPNGKIGCRVSGMSWDIMGQCGRHRTGRPGTARLGTINEV